MLHLLRRPPVGFEEFVGDHFRRRGQHVIRVCEAYRDGSLVGKLDEEGNPTEGSTE
jgi:ubiquitin-conjugating enzyme E2 O